MILDAFFCHNGHFEIRYLRNIFEKDVIWGHTKNLSQYCIVLSLVSDPGQGTDEVVLLVCNEYSRYYLEMEMKNEKKILYWPKTTSENSQNFWG